MADDGKIFRIYLKLRSKLAWSVAGLVPPDAVEDIVQETYVRICQSRNVENIDSPKSFLFRTVRNLALDYRKRAEIKLADAVANIDSLPLNGSVAPVDHAFEQVASNEEFGLFCEAVRLLPAQCRRAFVLKKVYGYTQGEIARAMNISQNTVENHIALGIKRCTQFMQRHDERFGRRRRPVTRPQGSRVARSRNDAND
jgi:RNA polymerase sigma-70 factor (ECF subfamily)